MVGLSIAWQLLRSGRKVTLLERDRVGEGTSHVAAGMLAPEAEVNFGEEELMKLGQRSLELYPDFLSSLKEDSKEAPPLDPCGTVMVGKDRDDAEHLQRIFRFRKELGLNVEWWGGTEAREQLDLLSPNISSATHLPEDAQIDNRQLIRALKEATLGRGGNIREGSEVESIERKEEGWSVRGSGGELRFDELVLAAGAWSGSIQGAGSSDRDLYPVKGEILTLGRIEGVELDRMIRSPRVYIVPKSDGTIRVGGTSEERGYELTPTAGGVRELLEEAWELLPAIQDAPFHGVDVGLRPTHPDHFPWIGKDGAGLIHATGHYRHGILLAPISAYAVREILDKGESEAVELRNRPLP